MTRRLLLPCRRPRPDRRCPIRTDRGAARLAALAAIALGLAASPARADDRADREAARREFAAGQAADKAGDWQAAIEHYLRANERKPHPFALYNIAADHEHLGNLREAAVWYQRYLDASPSAANRDSVLRLLADLPGRPARLSVTSIPDRAAVTIDGAPAGTTPLITTLRGGSHRIAVERDGQRAERTVEAAYAEPIDVQLVLRAATGTLDARGQPVGALISVDRVPVGRLPAQLAIAPGIHAIHVERDGYLPLDTEVSIAAGTTTPLAVELIAAGGFVGGVGPAGPGGLGGLGGAPVLDLGYLFGLAGGADAKGTGATVLGEFAVRLGQYEGGVRIGRVAGTTGVDFLVRWSLIGDSPLTPYVGVGYSYIGASFGYEALVGVRYDLSRDRIGLTVRADLGARSLVRTTTAADGTMTTDSAVMVPIAITVEAVYRGLPTAPRAAGR